MSLGIRSLDKSDQWLNSEPLTAAGLQGNVVLVDFWTYTCINWLRTLPFVRAWAEKYADRGLVVVGVHTPEFSFEHDIENVRRAVKDMRIEYPVVIDNDYAIWQAFDNNYWPALFFVDADGRTRHHHFGEGAYDDSELMIQQLLNETGREGTGDGMVSIDGRGIEAAADWGSLNSPENYLGSDRTQNFDSADERPQLNHWSLEGDWTLGKEAIALNAVDGTIAYRFHARDLHLVMGPAARGASARFHVRLDGNAPGAAHGVDVDEEGNGTASEQRLYQLVRQPGQVGDRTFEITFLDPGVEAYAFTFG